MAATNNFRFTNWSETFSCQPAKYFHPTDEQGIIEVIRMATQNGQTIKAIGAGHSPSDVACTSGYMINMDQYNKVLAVDKGLGRMTVEAGLRLKDLHVIASEYGLAVPNIGAISEQSVGGIIATGTHGSGEQFGILATMVIGLRLLLANETVINCSREHNKDIFLASLCNLGALGIVSTVTLQLEPIFRLRVIQTPHCLDDVLNNLPKLRAGSQHFRFFYFPRTDYAVTYDVDRTSESSSPSDFNWWRDRFFGFHVLEGSLWLSTFVPSLVPSINSVFYRFLFSTPSRRVGSNVEILNFDCLFKQHVTEWAIPSEHAPAALRELRELINTTKIPAHFPIEVRFVAPDDIWLSPAYQRHTCFIGIIMYRPYGKDVPIERYWSGYEKIMSKYEGRPHWAKAFSLGPLELRRLYPQFDKFLQLRQQLDPNGLFLNNYLQRHLLNNSTSIKAKL